MDASDILTLVGIGAGILIPLVGACYWSLVRRLDRFEELVTARIDDLARQRSAGDRLLHEKLDQLRAENSEQHAGFGERLSALEAVAPRA